MAHIEGKIDRDQISLVPLAFDQLIDENNQVRVFDAFVEYLDLEKLKFIYSEPKYMGRPSYNPKDMLKIYIYSYFNGIRSSRKIERECKRNVELMWLVSQLTPDFKTIADFRKENTEGIEKVFKEFSLFCSKSGLIGKEMVAIDGSKFRACNSRRRNITKGKAKKMIDHYEQAAKKYLKLLDSADKGNEESNEINVSEITEKLKNAKTRIAELIVMQEQIEKAGEISLTDPDSRHMSASNNGTDIAHNVQVAVDSKHHLVVALDVVSDPSDSKQLYKMANLAKNELGVDEIKALGDKGYYRGEDLRDCQKNGITAIVSKQKLTNKYGDPEYAKDMFVYDKERDIYICPQGKILSRKSKKTSKKQNFSCTDCNECPEREKCTKGDGGRMITESEYQKYYNVADKLFADNIDLYKQRQEIVEHTFGTVKRSLGYSYFLLKGNKKVKCESYLHFFIYNLKRVINIKGIIPLIYELNAVKQGN